MYVWLLIGTIASIYVTCLLAQRRGRNVTLWAWIAATIGPLAFVVFVLPDRRKNVELA
jgi:hypothetical protein